MRYFFVFVLVALAAFFAYAFNECFPQTLSRLERKVINRICSCKKSDQKKTDRLKKKLRQKPQIETQPSYLEPELRKICYAESGLHQFWPSDGVKDGVSHKKGELVRGSKNPNDIGICQINLDYWGKRADEFGYDLFEERDNIAMANWIYENYGTDPWNNSKFLWERM